MASNSTRQLASMSPWWVVIGFALLIADVPAMAQSLELSVKATFLTKFARYVIWPDGLPPTGRPIALCIVGNDPFGRLIDEAAQSDPAAFAVRRLESTEQAGDCQVAFLGATSRQSTDQMVAALRDQPVLTVTDAKMGTARGIIHFQVQRGKVGFHIDNAIAARAKLSISSRLLQLALSVRQGPV